MKKKIYLICYAIVQIVVSVYMMVCANSVAAEQVQMIEDSFKSFPAEMQTMMAEVYNLETMVASVWMTAILGIILALILLWIFIKDKVSTKKGLTLGLTIASLVLFGGGVVLVMSVIALILIAKTEKAATEKVDKEKKELSRLRPLKVTSKDCLWVVVLVLAYSTQFIVPNFIDNVIFGVIYEIAFYILVFTLVIYIFSKRLKRDFRALKDNFSTYIGYVFKWWGIMLGISLVVGIIRMFLGGSGVTENQGILNSLPLWYVAPLAMIWAPVVEEGIFRGGLRRFIKNDKLFIVLSAILFGLLHTIGSEMGIYNIFIQSLQYMAMGGVMAYTYSKTNNIFVNMGIHCIQNTFGVLMMLLMSLV